MGVYKKERKKKYSGITLARIRAGESTLSSHRPVPNSNGPCHGGFSLSSENKTRVNNRIGARIDSDSRTC